MPTWIAWTASCRAKAPLGVSQLAESSSASREHAAWGLEDYGFRALLAPSFADIFYNNCFKNGLLPVKLDEATVGELFLRAARYPRYRLTVDLQQCTIRDEHALSLSFQLDESRRRCLLEGLDEIALTLHQQEKIATYERDHGIS